MDAVKMIDQTSWIPPLLRNHIGRKSVVEHFWNLSSVKTVNVQKSFFSAFWQLKKNEVFLLKKMLHKLDEVLYIPNVNLMRMVQL